MPPGAPDPGPPVTGVPDTVGEIVASLRQDPILLATMLGNGHTAEIGAALRDKVDDASAPVFVVLTRTPVGLDPVTADEEIASIVHDRLGTDGVYVVQTSLGYGHVGVWGPLAEDETAISSFGYRAADQVEARLDGDFGDYPAMAPAFDAAAILDALALDPVPEYGEPVLSTSQAEGYATEVWVESSYEGISDVDVVPIGLSTLVAVALGVVAGGVALRLLRAAAAPAATGRAGRPADVRRPRPPRVTAAAAPVPAGRRERLESLRARARAELTTLEEALEGPASHDVSDERLTLAIGSRDVVVGLLASDDPLDLVGASVLALTGISAVTSSSGAVYRCCYLDPTHGRGRYRVELAGGSVPVCRPCQRDLEAGREPSALLEARPGPDRPYYAGSTVWARTGFGTLVDDLWVQVRQERRR